MNRIFSISPSSDLAKQLGNYPSWAARPPSVSPTLIEFPDLGHGPQIQAPVSSMKLC
jgi:hypothetical protein